ncbi:MAG TPA: homoserine kinase [Candidatus Saccharimonadales bacterium]|nr:homoserine kinase [Candidatus Saccharimonadales bacterium]
MNAVAVPATTANLGCAFDCAALALDLHLFAEASRRADAGCEVLCEGEGAQSLPRDSSNLVARGISRLAEWSGVPVPGLSIRIRSQIPVGVGLGSSAAAIVAGLLIGIQIFETRPDDESLIGLAAEIEGHPDNVAAACLGGLVVAAADPRSGRVMVRKARVPAELRFVAVVPDMPLSTDEARALLPDTYTRADAVHNLQRAALLAASAFSGDFDFVPEFFADRWHQAQRALAVPGLGECLALQHPELLGVFLSGAGSAVVAVTRGEVPEIGDLLQNCFMRSGLSSRALTLSADNEGARAQPEWS